MKNFIKKQYRKVETYFLDNADIRDLNVQAAKRNMAVSTHLSLDAESLQRQTLREWQMAVLLATDTQHPNREQLKNLYKNLLLDNHLASTIESRVLYSQRAKFKITDQAGEEVEELSELLERTWFEDFIKFTLNSRFEGTQLIELFEIDNYTKELSEVELIPISHFNPIKGIITKHPGDEKGWAYKEGFLRRHYIQAGRDKSLGMLAEIAPVALGKKMGWGAWLDYIDKYGVGNLFITTEHQDRPSLARLENAARNFKATGWMVTNGGEKFEIKGNEAGNPQNFDLLIVRANSEMSKRVLGGSGLTDDKAFVGSAEIQFQLAKDRYDSDLLLLKNIINQQLFPRLAQLSPVYAPFATHRFEWEDKTEDKEKLADTVAKLAPHFYMDEEEISQRLGITLTQKSAPEKQSAEKKKTNLKEAFQEIEAYYTDQHVCGHQHTPEIKAVDVETWVKVMERIARDTYDGKIKPGELDREHVKKTFDQLNEGVAKGYGKNWKTSKESNILSPEVIKMKQNIFRFSGAKDAEMLKRINELLTENGKAKTWEDFKKDVLKLNRSYNINYLQAEWQTAIEAGRKAKVWEDYQENVDLYPNLVYRTQNDDRVREEHDKLKGIVKPLNDPFWDAYFPPNGWRCRCYTVQTAESPTPDEKMPEITDKDVRPEFRNNVGKTGQVFKEDSENGGKPHPFFRLSILTDYKVAFELLKYDAPYTRIKGTKVRESIFADMRGTNRIENINEAILISKNLNLSVDILPLINLKNHSSPEFRINGIIGDGVHRKGNITNTVSNAFSNKLGKNGQLSKLDKTFISVNYGKVDKVSNKDFKKIVNSVYGKMTNNKQVEFLIISFNENSIIIYNKDIPNNQTEGYDYIFKKLYSIKNAEGNK